MISFSLFISLSFEVWCAGALFTWDLNTTTHTHMHMHVCERWAMSRQMLAILFLSAFYLSLFVGFWLFFCRFLFASRSTFVFAFARTNQFFCICLVVVLAVVLPFSFINLVRCMEFVRSKTCHATFRLAARPPPLSCIDIAIHAATSVPAAVDVCRQHCATYL